MAILKEDNRGLDKLLRVLESVVRHEVDAGSMDGSQHGTFDGTVSALAAAYEFGFTDQTGRDVQVPFMQPVDNGMRESASPVNQALRQLVPIMFDCRISVDDILAEVGSTLAHEYQGFIMADKARGSLGPKTDGIRLIEGGELVDSFDYEVR